MQKHHVSSFTGPAKSLFKQEYYHSLKKSLKPDGILCSQGECQWLHIDLIKTVMDFCRQLFPVVRYAYTTIPTYPSGQIGFILCSNSKVRWTVYQLDFSFV